MTIAELIRKRRAELGERVVAIADLIEMGEALP